MDRASRHHRPPQRVEQFPHPRRDGHPGRAPGELPGVARELGGPGGVGVAPRLVAGPRRRLERLQPAQRVLARRGPRSRAERIERLDREELAAEFPREPRRGRQRPGDGSVVRHPRADGLQPLALRAQPRTEARLGHALDDRAWRRLPFREQKADDLRDGLPGRREQRDAQWRPRSEHLLAQLHGEAPALGDEHGAGPQRHPARGVRPPPEARHDGAAQPLRGRWIGEVRGEHGPRRVRPQRVCARAVAGPHGRREDAGPRGAQTTARGQEPQRRGGRRERAVAPRRVRGAHLSAPVRASRAAAPGPLRERAARGARP